MEAAEGKLFKPLAFTKTFALIAAIIVAITIIPSLAHSIFSFRSKNNFLTYVGNTLAFLGGLLLGYFYDPFPNFPAIRSFCRPGLGVEPGAERTVVGPSRRFCIALN